MFVEGLREMGLDSEMGSNDMVVLFRTLDRNGGGQLQMEELASAIRYVVDPNPKKFANDKNLSAGMIKRINALKAVGEGGGGAVGKGTTDGGSSGGAAPSAVVNPVQQLRDSLAQQAARVIDLFRRWDANGDGVISREEFRKGAIELGFLACLPSEIDRLFAVFDMDGSGDISFKELHRMLRKTVVVPEKKTSVVTVVDPIDLNALRRQLKHQVLSMSMQAEIQLATQIDVMTGESKKGRLGLLPMEAMHLVQADEQMVQEAALASEKEDRTNEQLINAMELAGGVDFDGDGDIGRRCVEWADKFIHPLT